MALGKGILEGKKTYITAGMGALGFIVAYLLGDIELGSAINGVFTAIIGATLRRGIKTETE